MPYKAGHRLGPYEIQDLVGSGGMGEVYRARDSRLGRSVAIKVLHPGSADDEERVRRFLAEARSASALNHPNILTVHEIGEDEGAPFLVTELVEGSTVREMLRDGPLGPALALDIAYQTAMGLARAHGTGIVHRDIKPENLMVSADGLVKILDFGLAKLVDPARLDLPPDAGLTVTGTLVGTPSYLSPEQLRGLPADERSDVFALGITLREMLTGGNPFQGATMAETFDRILNRTPPPLPDATAGAVHSHLSSLLSDMLSKDPGKRPSHAGMVVARLRPLVDASRSGSAELEAPPARRPPVVWATLVAVLGVVLVAGWLTGRSGFFSPSPPSVLEGTLAPLPLPSDRLTVAVLPVKDDTGDSLLARAGIGPILSDALVRILSDLPSIYIVSPLRLESAAGLLGRPLSDAADDLAFGRDVSETAQARAMLAGSLRKVGTSYVLGINLTGLPSQTLLGSYQAQVEDVSRLLPELTGPIGEEIRETFATSGVDASPAPLGEAATRSMEAYAHLIRGNDMSAAGNWEAAIPELKEAISIDPQLGLGWSALACAYSFAGDDASSRAAQREAEKHVDRVNAKERLWIQLNGIWVHTGNGELYMPEVREFIESYPDDRDGYFYAGLASEWLLEDCGQALDYYEQAYQLTPNYYPITKGLVDCRLKLGEPEAARDALRRYLEVPNLTEDGRAQAEGSLRELNEES